MLQAAFLKIMEQYPFESSKRFTDNELAGYLRHKFPELVRSYFPKYGSFIWHASPGQGGWADAPWLAIFNPSITHTAQKGYYPVYLFSNSLNSVYLSLNQGMAILKRAHGTPQAKNILSRRAEILREKLYPEYTEKFNSDSIDLEHVGSQTRLAMYEHGHVFGVKYTKDNLPSDERIISDLESMLELYNLAFHLNGTEEFAGDTPISDHSDDDELIAEPKIMRVHKAAERSSKLISRVKELHGYTCEICLMNFEDKYGIFGRHFIEAHHLTPFSELPEDKVVLLSPRDDFAVVCSNCHSMLHRKGAPENFDEFREYYRKLAKI